MKLTIIGSFVVHVYLIIKIKLSSAETSGRHARNVYDVLDIVQNAVKVFETAHSLGIKNDYLLNSEVREKLFKNNLLKLIPIFLKISQSAQIRRCFQDLWYLEESLNFQDIKDSWALQMLDSFGRPESGFLEGNFQWIGNFDECRNAYAPKKKGSDVGGYHGQYCSLKLALDIIPITIGICLPETCNPSDFEPVFNLSNLIPTFYKPDLKLKIDSLTCKANTGNLSKAGIITICIISVFIFLVILGSSVTAFKICSNYESESSKDSWRNDRDLKSVAINFDYEKLSYGIPNIHFVRNGEIPSTVLDSEHIFSRHDSFRLRNHAEKFNIKPNDHENHQNLEGFIAKCDAFLNCFCVFTNGSKIFDTKVNEGQLLCIHGIRVLSMTWVIFCHVYLSSALVIRIMKDVVPRIDNLFSQILLNGWYSVDSFFVISGFLMSYLYFQERTRISEISWINFYFHRFLRLTPTYMIILAFFATVMPFLGSGPFWVDYKIEEHCQKTWWWNLLFINNFQDLFDECMPWSWYLANEMQFFIISPLFLITLWRWPKIGYSILALLLCVSWTAGFFITYYYGLVAGTISNVSDIAKDPRGFLYDWNTYMRQIYLRPYIRIAPYLIGIALGHIIFKRRNRSVKISQIRLCFGWLLTVPVIVYCICGFYGKTPGIMGASFYNALSRTGWGLSVGWVMFACLSGHGGVVDKILSYRFFIPLSRLTYCAYLIHPLFIGFYIFTLRATLAFSHPTMILMFMGLIIVTFAASILVSLIFESPIIRLEKLVQNKIQSRCKHS